ncbi:MFS transporter [Streptomyces sp. NPDC058001]|uniref:MFS transporter n=1 Tax=Streptomyces sp. NPDC058001 TaxID=3346300 RepID=UPI0036F08700
MVATDLIRAAVALTLPFVTQVWQDYDLIFLLQAASAAFTPTFQAAIPELLPVERDYTQALSMSPLAYDLESLLCPALAADLLALVSYDWLFVGTTAGFLASAALVVFAVLPRPAPARRRTGGIRAKTVFGTRLFWATPRLRALLALDLAVAAAGAIVFVNTVVLVRDHFGRPASDLSPGARRLRRGLDRHGAAAAPVPATDRRPTAHALRCPRPARDPRRPDHRRARHPALGRGTPRLGRDRCRLLRRPHHPAGR